MSSVPERSSTTGSNQPSNSTEHHGHEKATPKHQYQEMSKWQVHRATRTRKQWSLIAAFLLLIALIFLILVEVGNTSNKPVLRNTWFISLNLTNVVPSSVGPEATLLNSIAQTLGLHDFYQVGLWNYCEGYNNQGVTSCSATSARFWFDPVGIIVSQLLSGSSINLPEELRSILDIIRIASHWMFGLFITGSCLTLVLIFISPISIYSRWLALLMGVLSFVNALFVTAASIIATVMFTIMRNVFAQQESINIGATVGTQMLAFMWIASGCTLIAFVIQLCLMCCCASRRDIRLGKKRGNKKAYDAY